MTKSRAPIFGLELRPVAVLLVTLALTAGAVARAPGFTLADVAIAAFGVAAALALFLFARAQETARRRAEHAAIDLSIADAAVRESESRYRFLFEQNPLACYVYDTNTMQILACNEAALEQYGYTREEFLALTLLDLRPAEERERLLEFHHRPQTKQGDVGLWRHVRKDGSELLVRIMRRRAVLEEQKVSIVISIDVTEQQRVEDQLRNAQKMEAVGRLAGGVAHDFNNILTTIIGNTELLLEDPALGDVARSDLIEIRESGARATRLTRQLLAFSRRQVLQPAPVDMLQVTQGIDRMLQKGLGEHIRLDIHAADDLRRVFADHAQMEQVLLNLIVNARDAMPDGGRVTISLCNKHVDEEEASRLDLREGDYVELSVADTGTGIAPEIMKNLFEPFFTTKPAGQGTGLGLPTVHGIVVQSGGAIEVESEVGVGTTFRVVLPTAS